MDKINFIESTNPISGEVVEHAIIDHGNEQFTSMPKSIYDELKANEATTI
jgi:predicted aspartyl protease